MRRRTWALGLAALVVVAWLATLAVLPPAPFTAPPPAWSSSGIEARGAFHVHTVRSDGTGTVDEVAAAAARAGLQFVILTDHGDGTRNPDPPAYRSGVLCIDAVEVSTTGGHYAAIGLGRTPYPLGGEPRDVVEDVRRLGGFGIATHPLSSKSGLAWRAWGVRVDGVEWLNGDSLWRDVPASRLAASAWSYVWRPVASLARLYQRPAMLSRWDALDRSWRVVALAGTDAHARLGFSEAPEPYENPVYLKTPSYRVAFSLASIRVFLSTRLSGVAASDAAAVVDAIRTGRVHTVVDGLGRGGAFEFTASSGGATAREGGLLPLTDPCVIRVRSNPPPDGWVVLFRNGGQVHRVKDQELVYASDQAGTYRAEVWVPSPGRTGFVPWIVGNPIVVGEPEPLVSPAAVNEVGPPVPVGSDPGGWRVEVGGGSRATVDTEVGTGLRYSLGGERAASPYAALETNTTIPDGAGGIAFLARSEHPMRLSVQLRAPTAGDGIRWGRSVYLDSTPREVFIPFAEMTGVGRTAPTAPRLTDVRALLFVVDLVNTAPGTSGRFLLKDVRFYSPR